jgi:hypothetical protein
MWWLPQTSGTHIQESRQFESMYTYRENPDQHATCFSRSVRVWTSTIRISRCPHIATFHESSSGLDGCTAPEKKCSWLHLSARLSGLGDPPQFIFQHNYGSGALKPSTCWRQATRLTRPISLAYDRSLTDTGGGYNLRGASLPHHTLQLSHPAVSTFHLRSPPDLRLSIPQL